MSVKNFDRRDKRANLHSGEVAHNRSPYDLESGMDLSAWLRGLGLGQYEQAFRDNAIEREVLPQLTAEDLKEIGVVPVGHRRKLLDAIAALCVSEVPASDKARGGRMLVASPVDPSGERRQVTVLFADLSGYTEWGQRLDAEEVHALLQQFFDRVDSIIQQHGGRTLATA